MSKKIKTHSKVAQELAALDKFLSHPNKWCKGTLTNGNGRYCLLGALDAIGTDSATTLALINVKPIEYDSIQAFNDSPKTSFKDIKALIKKARKAAVCK